MVSKPEPERVAWAKPLLQAVFTSAPCIEPGTRRTQSKKTPAALGSAGVPVFHRPMDGLVEPTAPVSGAV